MTVTDKGNNTDNPIVKASDQALAEYNKDYHTQYSWNTGWEKGQNWTSEGTQFETLINNYFFPKIRATTLAQQNLGNRFDFLAKEVPDVTTWLNEDYVIADSVPTGLNLAKPVENMLKVNYPKVMTKLYSGTNFLKEKFTLNDNDATLNFQTLGDAINYVTAVYRKRVSDINMYEELMIKSMLVDYGMNHVQDQRKVNSRDELVSAVGEALLNVQNNSWKHNEANTASGGAVGRYSTYTPLKDVFILTNDSTKEFLLNTIVANTFQVAGVDFTDRVISFDDLGGSYKLTKDVTIQNDTTAKKLRDLGAYETTTGETIYASTVMPYDLSGLPEFSGAYQEIKPTGDLFALVCDINSVGYKRKTANMLKKPFYNPERDEVTYWMHYQAQRYIRPFFNKILIYGTSGMNPADKHVID